MTQFVCDACLAGAPEWMCVCDDDRAAEAASVDTRPQGGDVKHAPFTGGAVGSEADETPKEPTP